MIIMVVMIAISLLHGQILAPPATCAVELMRRSTVALRGAMASFSTSLGDRGENRLGQPAKVGKTMEKPWKKAGKPWKIPRKPMEIYRKTARKHG